MYLKEYLCWNQGKTFIPYDIQNPCQYYLTLSNRYLIDINDELSAVYNWLAVNKLSLNIKKTKYMIFHAINN